MIRVIPEQVCLQHTDFSFREQVEYYRGKVRDVYYLKDKIVLITTDRISAFDHVLPRPIPYKGQVLNQIAVYFLNAVKDICPVWIEDSPDPNVAVGKKCNAIPIEMVVRGYMAGHLWREYKAGRKTVCGVLLRDGYREGDRLDHPIITPTTKASEGHDEDISLNEIVSKQIISKELLDAISEYSLALFQRGTEMAVEKGLILVDTKYEFGLYENKPMLMDEIHTPDSSRYYISHGYDARQEKGERQIQLSKEFVREWLISMGFQGKEDQLMPEMPEAFVWEISQRYQQLFEQITGAPLIKDNNLHIRKRIEDNLHDYLI